jgi:hypothetical protein
MYSVEAEQPRTIALLRKPKRHISISQHWTPDTSASASDLSVPSPYDSPGSLAVEDKSGMVNQSNGTGSRSSHHHPSRFSMGQ